MNCKQIIFISIKLWSVGARIDRQTGTTGGRVFGELSSDEVVSPSVAILVL